MSTLAIILSLKAPVSKDSEQELRHFIEMILLRSRAQGFPGGSVVKDLPAGDTGSIPGPGKSHT